MFNYVNGSVGGTCTNGKRNEYTMVSLWSDVESELASNRDTHVRLEVWGSVSPPNPNYEVFSGIPNQPHDHDQGMYQPFFVQVLGSRLYYYY